MGVVVAVLMYLAGCLWLLAGALAISEGALGARGSEIGRLSTLLTLSFGVVFIGIGGAHPGPE